MLILTLGLIGHARADSLNLPEARVTTGKEGACIPGDPCRAVALVPTVGVGVTRVSFGDDLAIGRELTLGVGASAAWYRGTFRIHNGASGRSYALEEATPYLYLGVAGFGGVAESGAGTIGSFSVVGLVGSRSVALAGGYDVAVGAPFVGVVLEVLGTTVAPGAGAVMGVGR